ncbi:uncharacterized protein HD556DRAFT_1305963 [Suillus plorans]|uniref:Uncharacterized protein n=1 Tax=Suillus plorans TaxID=116603 RepID=A0A9P7J183_9AGAM|nr:uncharacterized protein HD556DRAFT_1305963 [Suillus plorans]KAG1798501.1 hypothetical protein HD556DRAFT_1305963 [Suillus plorans]
MKWSLRAVNILTGLKVLSLVFLVFTGALVLGGFTHISDPYANSLATTLVKTNFAFAGWHSMFNVIGEVHTRDPVRTVRKAGVTRQQLLVTTRNKCVRPKGFAVSKELRISNDLLLLGGRKVNNVSDVKTDNCAPSGDRYDRTGHREDKCVEKYWVRWAGNIGSVRLASDCIRLLVRHAYYVRLPTKGYFRIQDFCIDQAIWHAIGTFALPARDAFNSFLDLSSYLNLVFNATTAIGLWLLQKWQALADLAPSKYRVGNVYVSLYLLSAVFLLIMPWVPPEPGHSDMSFCYCVVGLGVLAVCGFYYWLWIIVLPWLGGYTIMEEVERLEDGALTTRLTHKYHPSVESVDNGEQQPLIAST